MNLRIPYRSEEATLAARKAAGDDRLAAWKDLQWATSLIMGRFAIDLSADGLTLEEFDVLVHLAWARDGQLPLRELVASMVSGYQLSRSGLTRLLDRMERDGLVERSLSRVDRRQFDVAITVHGRAIFDRVWPGHVDGIVRYFSEPLSNQDVATLKRILAKLIRANEESASG
ncbi:MAG: MarR family winged helix-turn-helix transcriptional regulator [Candidatus Limnocylindria bacterium]